MHWHGFEQEDLATEIATLRAQLHEAIQTGLSDEARFHIQRQAVIDDLHAFNVRGGGWGRWLRRLEGVEEIVHSAFAFSYVHYICASMCYV
jgi:hypothetical protein